MATTATINQGLAGSEEASLILASRQGDQQAFNQLVLRYQDRIYNLAARILGDVDSAGDITQHTFMTAYLKLSGFRNGSFRSWLYRIATNACYDFYRQHHSHPVISIENKELAEEQLQPLDGFSTSPGTPEKEFERRELGRALREALSQLAIDQRSLVILVDQQELDYSEAAQILGVPVGTVKSRLARARQRLRVLLSSSLGGTPVA